VGAAAWALGLGAAGGYAYSTQAYDLETVRSTAGKIANDKAASGAAKWAAEAYLGSRMQLDEWVRHYADPSSEMLLPDLPPHLRGTVRTLVLDLDHTLVHSDWTRSRGWRVFKRPGVEDFLAAMSQYYEIVVYTSQLSTYAEPIIDRLDPNRYISYRLYRDATQYTGGEHVRDLSKLNRDLNLVLFLGADPKAYSLQPENALPVKSYKMEDGDTALLDLMPLLEAVVKQQAPDVRKVVAAYKDCDDIPAAFKERTKAAQRRLRQHSKNRRSFLARGGSVGSAAKFKE
jgi:import inner membrane translocase subunit TIM50